MKVQKTVKKNKDWIVYVSTFPPRECGIATFTQDLTDAIDQVYSSSLESKIIALNSDELVRYRYPSKVILQINQNREEDYVEAAKKLNSLHKVKFISIQHEFGIYGGEYGSYVLSFLNELKKPSTITFHTVLPGPDEKRRQMVSGIASKVKAVIVMTKNSKDILSRDYGIEENKINIIPHGIHNLPYRTNEKAKRSLGFSKKPVISTFGLINRGKGIEFLIESLPPVVEKFPNLQCLILGATHPVVLKEEGESYRNFLYEKVYELGLSKNVKFYNKYFDLEDLFRFLEATDIYISPSLDPNQAVSGTLSYAMGAGRAVISTAFAQAKEDITPDIGLLVDFRNSSSYSNALLKLLSDKNLCDEMGKRAYFRTRHMTWINVAISYVKVFAKSSNDLAGLRKEIPPIKLNHIKELTDDFGMIQFAKLTEPDLSFGYTVDDNARALMAMATYYQKYKSPLALNLLSIYLKFLEFTWTPAGFENYVKGDKTINLEQNRKESMEDASARALFALANAATLKGIPKKFADRAMALLKKSCEARITFTYPRAYSFFIKALNMLLINKKNPEMENVLKNYCDKLVALYESKSSDDWEWFEEFLTYSNASLSEALLLGYKITGNKKYFEIGKKSLDFLIKETFKDGMYMAIGQAGWYGKGGTRTYFDQQPEDVSSMIKALKTIYEITKKDSYKNLIYQAFSWFLGNNILGQVVYDRVTGGCYDGVGEKNINLNQGAESTVLYLLARLAVDDLK